MTGFINSLIINYMPGITTNLETMGRDGVESEELPKDQEGWAYPRIPFVSPETGSVSYLLLTPQELLEQSKNVRQELS